MKRKHNFERLFTSIRAEDMAILQEYSELFCVPISQIVRDALREYFTMHRILETIRTGRETRDKLTKEAEQHMARIAAQEEKTA